MDFDALLREHRREVFSVCRAMVRDREVADELAQDALARAFAARGTFRGEASGRTWLLTIARNSCRDHLRRLRGSPFVDDPDTDEQGPQDDSPGPAERWRCHPHPVPPLPLRQPPQPPPQRLRPASPSSWPGCSEAQRREDPDGSSLPAGVRVATCVVNGV